MCCHEKTCEVLSWATRRAGLASRIEMDAAERPKWHSVAAGETVAGIALRYRLRPAELRRLNGLLPSETLFTGQRVLVAQPPRRPLKPEGAAPAPPPADGAAPVMQWWRLRCSWSRFTELKPGGPPAPPSGRGEQCVRSCTSSCASEQWWHR